MACRRLCLPTRGRWSAVVCAVGPRPVVCRRLYCRPVAGGLVGGCLSARDRWSAKVWSRGSGSSAVPAAGDMPFFLVVCMWGGGGGRWDWELLRSSVDLLSLVSLIMYSFKLYITIHMRPFVVPVLHNSIFQTRYVCSNFIVLPFV